MCPDSEEEAGLLADRGQENKLMEMCRNYARYLAQQLWGPQANACIADFPYHGQTHWVGSCTYACNDGKGKVSVYGWGMSFEDAFEDAKKRYKYWTLESLKAAKEEGK